MLLDRKWTNETTDHATPVSEGKRPTFLTFLALLLDGLGGLTVGGGRGVSLLAVLQGQSARAHVVLRVALRPGSLLVPAGF